MSKYRRSVVRYTLESGSNVDTWHRFSRDHQDDASALAAIERYCAQRGYIIDQQWGRPATSGSVITSTREFLEFISAMEERPTNERRQRGIVLWSLSRLGRDQIETEYYTAHLRRLGYVILSISDPIPANDAAPIVEAVIRYQDEKDLERISASVKRSFEMIRGDGYVTGGFPPRGFVVVKEQNKSHPTKHKGLPRINARWVRGGPYEQAIAQAWVMKVRGSSDTEIHEATHAYRDTHCYHDMWRRRCYVEAGYVAEEDWQAVQRIMDERRRNGHRPRLGTSSYLLAGLVHCTCGRLMIGYAQPRQHNHTRRGAYRPGDDAISYYACPGNQKHAGCAMGKVHAEVLETAVIEILHDQVLTGEHLAAIRQQLGHDLATEQDRLSQQLAALRERHIRLSKEITNLTTAIAGGGAMSELVAAMQERVSERKRIEQQIGEAEYQKKTQNPEIVSDGHWSEAITWMRSGLAHGPQSPQARDVIRSLVQGVDIWPDKAGFTLRYYLGSCGAAFLGGTPGAVPPKLPQHLILRIEWGHPLTRYGNQYTTRQTS